MIPLSMIPWKLVGIGAVILVIGGLFWHDRHVTKQLKASREYVALLKSANGANLGTIEMQSKALGEWKKIAADATAAAQEALNRAQKARADADRVLADSNRLKEIDRALPDCNALLSTNLERACPGIAYGLRHHASGEDGIRRSSGSGRAPPAIKPSRRLRAEVSVRP